MIRQWKLKYKVELSLEEIAELCNPTLRGWMQYYGKYSPSCLEPVWTQFNIVLVNGLCVSTKRFPHWQIGVGRNFA
ncbi:group II intron maturase-specific domain-containing protein [Legionella cincinnatiensis]|uniref:group II intron maturase-specific domain-containing protein n=1 Tax=Legionella cincinnatiensis TaxID=28085 RepID=UPI002379D0B9|nr:group II intron maturase-specific domain-containing protein [Legionella cincinnatiensis]